MMPHGRMGQETTVRASKPLADALAGLAAAGVTCHVVMVDGALVHPSAPAPAQWSEVRLRTPGGMITLRRVGDGVSLNVFGNAAAGLLDVRDRVAAALVG